MFAAGCLPTFSLHFLETNGLFICWWCFGAADSGHFPEAAGITGNRNAQQLLVHPRKHNGVSTQLHKHNYDFKNETPFNLI